METTTKPKQRFVILIDGDRHKVEDPVVTGRQILDTAGRRPADEHIVFQQLKSGLLEELRFDETTDLRKSGVERFLTFKSDRSFRFMLEDRQFEWGASIITGRTLKKLAGVDSSAYDVWLEVRGAEDKKIGDCDDVDLSAPGTERFFTAKKTTTEG